MTVIVTFNVNGMPKTKGSMRYVGGRMIEGNHGSKQWRDIVTTAAFDAIGGVGEKLPNGFPVGGGSLPPDAPFRFPPPESRPGGAAPVPRGSPQDPAQGPAALLAVAGLSGAGRGRHGRSVAHSVAGGPPRANASPCGRLVDPERGVHRGPRVRGSVLLPRRNRSCLTRGWAFGGGAPHPAHPTQDEPDHCPDPPADPPPPGAAAGQRAGLTCRGDRGTTTLHPERSPRMSVGRSRSVGCAAGHGIRRPNHDPRGHSPSITSCRSRRIPTFGMSEVI